MSSRATISVLAILTGGSCSPHESTPPIQPPTRDPQAAAASGDAGMGDATGGHLDALARSLEGVWCWPNVKDGSQNAHTLRFSSDAKKMHLDYVKPQMKPDGIPFPPVEYEIESIEQGRARMHMLGEDRMTDAGVRVVWDLVVLPDDRYCWHRTDWATDACTRPITRCPPHAEYGLDCAGQTPGETIDASIVLVQWAGVMHTQPGVTRTKAEALARATDCLDIVRRDGFPSAVEQCTDEPGGISRTGALGTIRRDQVQKVFANAAFSLCVGEVSDPVETLNGYTLILRTK